MLRTRVALVEAARNLAVKRVQELEGQGLRASSPSSSSRSNGYTAATGQQVIPSSQQGYQGAASGQSIRRALRSLQRMRQ